MLRSRASGASTPYKHPTDEIEEAKEREMEREFRIIADHGRRIYARDEGLPLDSEDGEDYYPGGIKMRQADKESFNFSDEGDNGK
jgi:hypothetical protein